MLSLYVRALRVGSYVAAWMMGVGDRHDGNTLIMQNGTLFHIDFSYVLGTFESLLVSSSRKGDLCTC